MLSSTDMKIALLPSDFHWTPETHFLTDDLQLASFLAGYGARQPIGFFFGAHGKAQYVFKNEKPLHDTKREWPSYQQMLTQHSTTVGHFNKAVKKARQQLSSSSTVQIKSDAMKF